MVFSPFYCIESLIVIETRVDVQIRLANVETVSVDVPIQPAIVMCFELSWRGTARVDTLTQSTGVVSSLFGQSGFFLLFNIIGSSLA